ncbi:MAG TPA: Yip1 family protein [Ktedonobacteraceae bacterium]|nr:Yip1 family protein [Ktedonobacteraceae bacterium]
MPNSPYQEQAGIEQLMPTGQAISSTQTNTVPSRSRVLSQLPQRYLNALVKPSLATYTADKGDASWSLVWIQLMAWAILDAMLGLLVNFIYPPATGTTFSRLFTLSTSIGLIALVPCLFFLLMGIVFLLAKTFGGQGTFLEQCNSSLYIQAPLGIFSKLLALIPVVGRVLNSVLSLYGIVLQVFVIMAVHRLSRGKAIATILIPLATLGLLAAVIFLLMRK